MDKYGKIIEPGVIRFERLLPARVEKVWSYLTVPEKRAEWLAGGEMELIAGGKVILEFDHSRLSPNDDPVPEKYAHYQSGGHELHGVITRCEPPLLLSYTWGETNESPSEVTFELTPRGDHTLLILTHRRLGDNRKTLLSVASGWHTHLGILSDRLGGNTPSGFWMVHSQMEEVYDKHL